MAETIKDIKNRFDNCDKGGFSAFILDYEKDDRAGVQRLVLRAKNELAKLEAEKKRLYEMGAFERKYRGECPDICGIDEAGRGPLAGPVVAGAVILPEDADILYINDSKKLSPGLQKRWELVWLLLRR